MLRNIFNLSVLVLTGLVIFSMPVQAQEGIPFIRGDANADGTVDLSDVISTLGFLFQRQDEPVCDDAADSNDDGGLDISDPIYVLIHLFRGGNPPPAPGLECGVDPTPDVLGCASFPPCLEMGDVSISDRVLLSPSFKYWPEMGVYVTAFLRRRADQEIEAVLVTLDRSGRILNEEVFLTGCMQPEERLRSRAYLGYQRVSLAVFGDKLGVAIACGPALVYAELRGGQWRIDTLNIFNANSYRGVDLYFNPAKEGLPVIYATFVYEDWNIDKFTLYDSGCGVRLANGWFRCRNWSWSNGIEVDILPIPGKVEPDLFYRGWSSYLTYVPFGERGIQLDVERQDVAIGVDAIHNGSTIQASWVGSRPSLWNAWDLIHSQFVDGEWVHEVVSELAGGGTSITSFEEELLITFVTSTQRRLNLARRGPEGEWTIETLADDVSLEVWSEVAVDEENGILSVGYLEFRAEFNAELHVLQTSL